MNTTEQTETKRGYHFTGDTLRNGDPIPAILEWISADGPVVPCESGLHMSERPFDALQYAPGSTLHLVEIRGDLQSHGTPVDKWVGRERRIIATIDATELLRAFARWCALRVAHLWDCPEVVWMYLESGDESIRNAAVEAARAARESVATWTACEATWSAAWESVAAWKAWTACEATWSAAWESVAARAALAAARAAARAALAARAARAARAAQREKFQELVYAAFEKELEK